MTILDVKEISCEHCVSRINKLLEELNIKHEVNLANKTVAIDGDETTVKKAIEELDDIGFTASMN